MIEPYRIKRIKYNMYVFVLNPMYESFWSDIRIEQYIYSHAKRLRWGEVDIVKIGYKRFLIYVNEFNM